MRLSSLVKLPPKVAYFPRDVDTEADVSGLLRDYSTEMAGTGRTLVIDSGTYKHDLANLEFNGFYIIAAPDAVISSQLKTGGGIRLRGACGIEGGIWEQIKCRPFTVTEASVASNVATLRAPGHTFEVGDTVSPHCLVGLGTINDGSKTVTAVNGEYFSFAHTNADASATIPYERPDLYNTGPHAIWPSVMLVRSGATGNDTLWGTSDLVNWHLRDVTSRYAKGCTALFYGASEGHIHNYTGEDSSSDGFHMTLGCHHMRFTGRTKLRRTGDACFAMIGYRKNGLQSMIHDISVELLDVGELLYHGTGIDVGGVDGFSCERFIAENVYAAGINITADSGTYYLHGSRNVRFGHATLKTCGAAGNQPTGWDDIVHAPVTFVGGVTTGAPALEHRDVSDIHFDVLEIFNSRYRAINGSGLVKRVKAGLVHIYGGAATGANLNFIKDWEIERLVVEEAAGAGLSLGGSGTFGENIYKDIELYNLNNGTAIELVSASCDGTTVTMPTKTAHGLSGTPSFRTRGVRSGVTNVDSATAAAAADKDFALNQDWFGTLWAASTNYAFGDIVSPTVPNGFLYKDISDTGNSGSSEPTWPTTIGATVLDGGVTWACIASTAKVYTSISFPDANTITITLGATWQASNNYALGAIVLPTVRNGFRYGAVADAGSSGGSEPTWPTTVGNTVVDSGITWRCLDGLHATVDPQVYEFSQRIPQARIYKGGSASDDGILVAAGAPFYSTQIKRLRLVEQFLPLERLVEDLTTNGVRMFDGADLTGRTSGLLGIINDGTELGASGFQRMISGPYTGTPAGAVVAADTLYGVRVFLPQADWYNRLGFRCTTLEAGADVRMGIYTLQGDLVYAAAEMVDVLGSTGTKRQPIWVYLPRGWYVLGLVTNAAGTAQIAFHTIDGVNRAMFLEGLADWNVDPANADFRYTVAHTYGALPAAATFARASATTQPHLWIERGATT